MTPHESALINYLVGAIAGLSGCIGVLFAWFRANFKTVEEKLNDCEEDRQKLWAKIAEILAGGQVTAETFSIKTNSK